MFSAARFIARAARTSTACNAFQPIGGGLTALQQRGLAYLPGFAGPVIGEGRSSLCLSTIDKPGALEEVLRMFWKHDVNMTRIESKPKVFDATTCDFLVDFDGSLSAENIKAMLSELEDVCVTVQSVPPRTVPWFPTDISEIDNFSQKTLDAGAELDADHPGFSDPEYRDRRNMIVSLARSYKHGDELPRVEYTDTETETWGVAYNKLKAYHELYAVNTFKEVMKAFEDEVGFSPTKIPQLQDISQFLRSRTGFSLRPVGGLLSARDFLNGLAFKVFFSTQYIRHHTKPLYTPEPDIVHELLGHAPMFADPDFAQFSHEIGLASLGASDDDIRRLATCYWFSVEFGLCREDGAVKAYGAGLLSSFGELEYACSPDRPAGGTDERPELAPWDPEEAAATEYPITCYQPKYYVAESMADAKEKMRDYCDHSVNRPFNVRYDSDRDAVWVDRAVYRAEYKPTLQ